MHKGKGRPVTPLTSAATRRRRRAPARNRLAQTSGAGARSELGTPQGSTHPTAPGSPHFLPVAGSVPSHLPPFAPEGAWKRNRESLTAGTPHEFRKHHRFAAGMSDIFPE